MAKREQKLLAALVCNAPGSWTPARRQMIAKWLRRKAYEIEKNAHKLVADEPYTARHYA